MKDSVLFFESVSLFADIGKFGCHDSEFGLELFELGVGVGVWWELGFLGGFVVAVEVEGGPFGVLEFHLNL